MGFKNWLVYHLKTVVVLLLSIFSVFIGFGFIAQQQIVIGLLFIALAAVGVFYFHYRKEEDEIRRAQRKHGYR